MGRREVQITVHARLSAHNSEEDIRDEEEWGRLVEELDALVTRFEDSIGAFVISRSM